MKRFINKKLEKYLPEFVYGSIDGTITTFAIVAGIAGASLSPIIALILGISNVLADGFSMASSNYLSEKSKIDEDKNIKIKNEKALKTALATFLSFVMVGFMPIIPFLFTENFYLQNLGVYKPFFFSTILTLITFIFIGYIRGKISNQNKYKTSFETLAVGSTAAFISFYVGHLLNFLVK